MVEIEAFKTTLRFIYNGCKNVELTGESALAVLYIGIDQNFVHCSHYIIFTFISAMKYVIKQLESLCIDYLLNNINAGNVFTILQFCIDCQPDSRLMDGCKEFIQCKTEAVIKAESFIKISHECLTLLLEQESLDIAEVRLFEAVCYFYSSDSFEPSKYQTALLQVVGWAKAACEKSGDDPNDGKNIRSKLGTALHLIRFPAMSAQEFADIVGQFKFSSSPIIARILL